MKRDMVKISLTALKYFLKQDISSESELTRAKRLMAKKFSLKIVKNADILVAYQHYLRAKKISPQPNVSKRLRKRVVRTLSGVAPVAVLTKPFPCPGKCVYCPTEKDVPQSYLANEPAVMRAIRCDYQPYIQVWDRLRALTANGHQPKKIELIVIGGTWSALPDQYQYWFIAECFRAANDFLYSVSQKQKNKKRSLSVTAKPENIKKALQREQKRNESAEYKIIGITLETRPDYINKKELWQMRELGATRVELGVQAIDDHILKINKRGHGVKEVVLATEKLKNFGFKITYHIMPGLPGATAKKDLVMYKQLFSDERFQPDQIKFYPTVVTRGSLLYRWYKSGKYHPYTDKTLQDLIVKAKLATPAYVRIIRLIRDIPAESIIAGNKITNLRQIMQERGVRCQCIRCREAKNKKIVKPQLRIINYQSSGGREYFISFESADFSTLYGFCRLRLAPSAVISGAAIIRELHVYGELMPIGSTGRVQHKGLGKKLLATAEKIARQANYEKMIIISGIGVRSYYRNQGYRLYKTYLVKKLTKNKKNNKIIKIK